MWLVMLQMEFVERRGNKFMAKVGRNQPCPCGSKRKYKHCCLLQHDGMRVNVKTDTPHDLDKQIIQRLIDETHERNMKEIIGRKEIKWT